MTSEPDGGEMQLIAWLCKQGAAPRGPHDITVGDDMATLPGPDGQPLLMASDMVLEGTHFDTGSTSLAAIGHKAMAACLSDCAAMAVQPVAAVVSLALPRGRVARTGQALLSAMMACAEDFGCPIIGGDTTSWHGPLAVDVTLVARPWPGVTPVRRSGALPGDLVVVTGALGGSRLGKHLQFTPRVHEARQLAEILQPDLHALIDISDGLALDLQRVCMASRCGAVLDRLALDAATSPAARQAAGQDGRTALQHVLDDGEDYELLMAVACGACGRLAEAGIEHHVIGRFTEKGLHLEDHDRTLPLTPAGFVH